MTKKKVCLCQPIVIHEQIEYQHVQKKKKLKS